MNLLLRILVTAFIVVALANLLPGVAVESYFTGIVIAIVLGLMNILVKPILILFTLPVTVVTFGLFLLVINALIILMVTGLVGGFYVDGFWWALLFSLLLSFCQSILFKAFENSKSN
ncbi:phage holin family protein [Mesonia aquimarina]|uniref:phage holin family protein n=1 Tax=Mesonia aquimarina TaxID=1504967 RepID=UPI000EF56825|nr:phage holin family protein [Mesonia aquimarina]